MATIDIALTFTQYKKIDNNGNVAATDDATFYTTEDLNAVEAGTNCTVTLNSGNYILVVFYDSNGNIADGDIETNTPDWSDQAGFSASFTTPSGTSYIRVLATSNSQVTGTLTKESADTPSTPGSDLLDSNGAYLVDDFTGTSLDRNKWSYELGYVRNNELQNYTSTNDVVSNGLIALRGLKDGSGNWTSSSIISVNKFTFMYGRIEARIKADISPGSFGAFWTLGDCFEFDYVENGEPGYLAPLYPDSGEFDVMEYYNGKLTCGIYLDDGTEVGRVWYTDYNANEWHTYAMEWYEDGSMKLYIDDHLISSTSASNNSALHIPHYILLNQAIGAAGGTPDSNDTEITQYVDWVKYYPLSTDNLSLYSTDFNLHLASQYDDDHAALVRVTYNDNCINKVLNWSSSNPALLSVHNGYVTTYSGANGSAVITATSNTGVSRSITLYVSNGIIRDTDTPIISESLVFTQYKEISEGDGSVIDTSNNTFYTTVDKTSVTPNSSYTITLNSGNYILVVFYDSNGNIVDGDIETNTPDWTDQAGFSTTFTVPANASHIRVLATSNSQVTGTLTKEGTTPIVPAIVLNTINNMIVDKGQAFNISYSTNVSAVKHEISWDGGSTYWDKTSEISVSNSVNYKYTHEAKTDVSSYNMAIRVTDAQGNTSTKSFTITFMDAIEPTDNNTQVLIYNKGELLTPVNTTPTTGQYKVDIVSTSNCTAQVESDFKTITLLTATSNSGEINLSINIEGKKVVPKTISVASITSSKVISSHYSEQQQLADKFSWLVKSGTSSSNMELTADAYNVISKNINLKADRLNLEGYTTINGGFSVDTAGNMSCTNANISGTITASIVNSDSFIGDVLAIDGTISAEKLSVKVIENPKYPGVLTENIKLFIGTNGDDNSELESWATFQTFDGLLDRLPKNLNGHEVHIEMSTDITENVEFKGFHGGRIKVLMKGHTLYGYVNSEMCSTRIAFYSGYIGDNTNEDNGWGKIHPSKGYPVGNYTTTVSCVDSGSIALYNIDVYGADNYLTGSSSKVGMAAFMWGSIYSNGTSCYGCDIMGRANVGGRIHDAASLNTAAKYGWNATSGGYITLASGSHTGGTTKNYHETHAGKVIVVDGTTFEGSNVQTPTTTAPTTSTTKTVTYKSNYGDTYRSSVYNSWKKDNTARQGDYGYGDCSGLWFFGDQFSDLKGKTINKVTIKITRQSGGSYAAVGLVVRTHNYGARPSGAPTLSSSSYGTLSLATGDTGTLTITNADVLNGISNGTVKGFGIRTAYDSAHYAVCSGSVTVKVTYSE